jgi:glycosyltransferase involved in cell wall biosynthesis
MRDLIHCDILVITNHPVQYLAPVFNALINSCGLKVHTVYGSDFSIAGYHDERFKTTVAWDARLVPNGSCTFLSRIDEGGAKSSKAVSARGLRSALDEYLRPGAVLLTGYSGRFYIRAFYEVLRRGYPVLFRAETTDGTYKRSHLKRWVRDIALRSLYSRCQRLLPIGVHSRQHYLRLGCPEAKLVLSPYCVDTTTFECGEAIRTTLRLGTREKLGIRSTDIAVLFVGKLYRHKGAHILVSAVCSLPAEERDRVVIIFVGDGEERRGLEEQAGSGIPVQVRFVGFKNQHELSPYYHAADVLALPSRSETWGLVVNEALHHGVPCVVTETVGCAVDLVDVGVTGEIAVVESVEDFRRALQRGFALIGRAEIRAQCRAKVNNYTVARAAEGIAAAYRSLQQSAAVTRGE